MKSVKRILAVIMAVVFILTMFSVCAFAEDDPYAPALKVTLTTDKEAYEPGDTVTVNVTMNTNFNYTTFRFPIMFDSSIYKAPALLTIDSYNTVKTNGEIKSNTNGQEFIPDSYAGGSWGCIIVQWTAAVAAGEVKALNTDGEDELSFSFTLTVNDDAERGATGTILIPPEYDGFYTQAIIDPTDATTIVYLKDTLAMNFVPANAEVVAADIDLIPASETSTAVVDRENGYLYGLREGMKTRDDFASYIKVNREDPKYSYSVEFTQYGVGTGAKISVLSGENIVKTYTVIIFGDYIGDGSADSFDLPILARIASGAMIAESAPQKFALDLNHDGATDSFDLPILARAASGAIIIDQVP